MTRLQILHFEDDPTDALLIGRAMERHGVDAEVTLVGSAEDYLAAIERGGLDAILVDNGLPGFSGKAALEIARTRCPDVPFIFVSGAAEETQALASLEAGATDFVLKDQLWQLVVALRRIAKGKASQPDAEQWKQHDRAMRRLVEAVQQLSLARSLDAIMQVVRRAARELTGADGATFILRDDDKCFYADEDAIAPLWKGRRFAMTACISGWAMLNRQPAVIEDIYVDPRIPVDAYRPTFVKSLVMVPIRVEAPIGAIGNYWAQPHRASADEVELLQALANTTSVAMEDVRLFTELEQRVRDRTLDLEAANRELEAFSYSVSHDLRTPLANVGALVEMLDEDACNVSSDKNRSCAARIRGEVKRMAALVDDLLRLAKLSRLELRRESVNLSQLAREITKRLQLQSASRKGDFRIDEDVVVRGDTGLLRVVMENLLSNAWKYSARREQAVIEFGSSAQPDGSVAYFVRDNGAGFDMQHADKLFVPFQRLHEEKDYAGHGIGLATVQRIVHRHGGRIWAQAEAGNGATFYFTIP